MANLSTPDNGTTVRVESLPVMRPGERSLFLGLTVLAALAIVAFSVRWISMGDSLRLGTSFLAFVIATLLIEFHLCSWFARWLLLWWMRRPTPLAPAPDLRVAVATSFVPSAEPIGMLAQTVRALVAMDYPHDTWVLDEGDSSEVAALCGILGARHYSRKSKLEFQTDAGPYARDTKYGNYNAWLSEVGRHQYDILASFDPDHVPESSFLDRGLGYFRDPHVAYVQAPQCYYNQAVSFIARGAAEESYAYYSSHQMASYGLGQPILVGSHNIQRITALEELGGFPPHDADDILITLRYRATRWRGVYLPAILVLGTTPVSWRSYLRQQVRWTRSVIDIKLHLLPGLLGRLPLRERLLGLFHGTYYLRAFAIPLGYGLLAWLLMRGTNPMFLRLGPLRLLAALAALLGTLGLFRRRFALDPGREGGLHWRAVLLQLAKWPYQCLATWRALRAQNSTYAITMKVHPASTRTLVLWPHWLVAEGMAIALVTGFLRDAAPVLLILAGAVILVSAVIAAAEFLPAPPPWEAQVYQNRRAEMTDVLGPVRPPVSTPALASPQPG